MDRLAQFGAREFTGVDNGLWPAPEWASGAPPLAADTGGPTLLPGPQGDEDGRVSLKRGSAPRSFRIEGRSAGRNWRRMRCTARETSRARCLREISTTRAPGEWSLRSWSARRIWGSGRWADCRPNSSPDPPGPENGSFARPAQAVMITSSVLSAGRGRGGDLGIGQDRDQVEVPVAPANTARRVPRVRHRDRHHDTQDSRDFCPISSRASSSVMGLRRPEPFTRKNSFPGRLGGRGFTGLGQAGPGLFASILAAMLLRHFAARLHRLRVELLQRGQDRP